MTWANAAAAIDRVVEVRGLGFTTLTKIGGLDPSRDLVRLNFTNVDFSGQDLGGFNFHGADMRGCVFHSARIRFADFTGAKLDDNALEEAVDYLAYKAYRSFLDGPNRAGAITDVQGRLIEFTDSDWFKYVIRGFRSQSLGFAAEALLSDRTSGFRPSINASLALGSALRHIPLVEGASAVVRWLAVYRRLPSQLRPREQMLSFFSETRLDGRPDASLLGSLLAGALRFDLRLASQMAVRAFGPEVGGAQRSYDDLLRLLWSPTGGYDQTVAARNLHYVTL